MKAVIGFIDRVEKHVEFTYDKILDIYRLMEVLNERMLAIEKPAKKIEVSKVTMNCAQCQHYRAVHPVNLTSYCASGRNVFTETNCSSLIKVVEL